MSSPTPCPERIPPDWGGELNESDHAALAASWITPELAKQAMLRRVDEVQGREVVGQKGKRDCAGVLIPYYWPGEPRPFNYRVRRDNPEYTVDKENRPKAHRKYLGPPNGANRLYIPPGVTLDQLSDVAIPIVLVEGEKKALALWRLANHETQTPRFIPIAIAGVWNWRGRVGKANGPQGERIDVKGPIPDLNRIAWKGRKVFIVFDANVHSNDSVKWARKGIARELATRGAEVQFVNLPEDCGVNGIDDLLAAWGPERVLELFEKPVPAAHLTVVLPPQFQAKPEGMFRVVTRDGQLSQTQLTNYRASIKTNVTLDDGVETKLEFEMEAELMGRRFPFTIPSSKFSAMEWPIEQMGSGAITYPNQKEYARTAIQSSSLEAEERRVYAHTGWRKIDGQWLYLHAGGAIGAAGDLQGIHVRLHGPLRRYELQLPKTKDALVSALQASVRVLELAPATISFPLRAATIRAIFGDSDYSIHVAGATGGFKSELAALEQQHFGAGMNRLNLPGAWASTANSIESLAFHAKDALVVIDDFAPHGNTADVARYHAAADRVFRAAGNRAGRGRLDSNAKLREPKPPRGLIVSTGEDIPRGHSVLARLLIMELSKGAIDPDQLTRCQEDAAAGLYAKAMGAFVKWVAGQYEDKLSELQRRATELRDGMASKGAHARTPDIIANLQSAFELYLLFAEDCGAINYDQRHILFGRCWAALCAAAAEQAKYQSENEPAARFITLIRACLASGKAHLASRAGTAPEWSPESCGWRVDRSTVSPQGDCIGWIDGDDLYLEPSVAYRCVQTFGRDGGEALPVTAQVLRKRLHEKGVLASIDKSRQTLTVRRKICGSSVDVLHFLRSTLLPESPADEDGDAG